MLLFLGFLILGSVNNNEDIKKYFKNNKNIKLIISKKNNNDGLMYFKNIFSNDKFLYNKNIKKFYYFDNMKNEYVIFNDDKLKDLYIDLLADSLPQKIEEKDDYKNPHKIIKKKYIFNDERNEAINWLSDDLKCKKMDIDVVSLPFEELQIVFNLNLRILHVFENCLKDNNERKKMKILERFIKKKNYVKNSYIFIKKESEAIKIFIKYEKDFYRSALIYKNLYGDFPWNNYNYLKNLKGFTKKYYDKYESK